MKSVAKSCLRCLSFVIVLPAVVLYQLHAAVAGADKAFPGWSQLMSTLPGTSGVYLRNAFYRSCLKRCDANASIGFGTLFSHPGVTIGNSAYIGNYCSIGDVEIGDDVLIASHVSIMNGCNQHRIDRLDVPVREQLGDYPPITIGEDSWIGERAIVAANVGKHCVVGAGSLVLNDLPDYSVAVGSPAQVIRDRRELAQGEPDGDSEQTPSHL